MFTLTEDQERRLREWKEECNQIALQLQKAKMPEYEWEMLCEYKDYPYLSVREVDDYTYSFRPRKDYTLVTVTNNYLDYSFDLTEHQEDED